MAGQPPKRKRIGSHHTVEAEGRESLCSRNDLCGDWAKKTWKADLVGGHGREILIGVIDDPLSEKQFQHESHRKKFRILEVVKAGILMKK